MQKTKQKTTRKAKPKAKPKGKFLAYNCTNRTIEFHVVGGTCLRLSPLEHTEITVDDRKSSAMKRLEFYRHVVVSTIRQRTEAESAAKNERARQAHKAQNEAKKRIKAIKKAAAEQEAATKKQAVERKAAEKKATKAATKKKAKKKPRSKKAAAKKPAPVAPSPTPVDETPVARISDGPTSSPSTERKADKPNAESSN